ncbi:MAG: OmpA family protein [Acidimicrobiales bacterium]
MKLPFRNRSPQPDRGPDGFEANEYDDGGLDTVGLASGELGRTLGDEHLALDDSDDTALLAHYREAERRAERRPERADVPGAPFSPPGFDDPDFDGSAHDGHLPPRTTSSDLGWSTSSDEGWSGSPDGGWSDGSTGEDDVFGAAAYSPPHDAGYSARQEPAPPRRAVPPPEPAGRRLAADPAGPGRDAPLGSEPDFAADFEGLEPAPEPGDRTPRTWRRSRRMRKLAEQYRGELDSEQRSAWAYLGVLVVLFVGLSGFGWACSGPRATDVAIISPVGADAHPVQVLVRIENDVIVVTGRVPDEAAEAQILDLSRKIYGDQNVIDELDLEADSSFDGGTIRFVGSANQADERAATLHDRLIEEIGLDDRGFDVSFVDASRPPIDVGMALQGDRVSLTGAVPDDGVVAAITTAAEEAWGVGNVDASALTVGNTTLAGGVVRATGSMDGSDQRIGTFSTRLLEQIPEIRIDTSGLVIAGDAQRTAEIQTQINGLVQATPITFVGDTAELAPESDPVLTQIAGLLNQVPGDTVEVVGYTDNTGDEAQQTARTQERADGVVARLVELGLGQDRITGRGAGAADPVGDNATEEGRAANRRIQFTVVTASGG